MPIPATQRAPFGWTTAAITAQQAPVVCAWQNLAKGITPTHLRVAIGLDERDEKTAEAFLPKSGRVIGTRLFGTLEEVFAQAAAKSAASLRN